MADSCPTCGQAVEVHTGGEGTSSYVSAELPNLTSRVVELEAALRAVLDDESCVGGRDFCSYCSAKDIARGALKESSAGAAS